MTFTWRNALIAAAATLMWTGCSTSPPGGGLTNGEPLIGVGSEKAAERTDLPTPNLTGGNESLAAPAAESRVDAPPAEGAAPKSATQPTPPATSGAPTNSK